MRISISVQYNKGQHDMLNTIKQSLRKTFGLEDSNGEKYFAQVISIDPIGWIKVEEEHQTDQQVRIIFKKVDNKHGLGYGTELFTIEDKAEKNPPNRVISFTMPMFDPDVYKLIVQITGIIIEKQGG